MDIRQSTVSVLSGRNTLGVRNSSRRKTTEILSFDERKWRWSYLKDQLRNPELDKIFKRYNEKISHGYFSLFLILQTCIGLSQFFLVLYSNIYNNMESNTIHIVLPDLILYSIAGVIPIVGIFLTESYVKKHPHVLRRASIFTFILLYIIDVGLPIYHNVKNNGNFRPSYTTHLIIACYIFFTVGTNLWAVIFGCFITITHIFILIFFTYVDSPVLLQRIGSDIIYYVCINGLGLYFRFMNEIVKRRGFLDRKDCVDSNLTLTFEQEQEEQLLSSIIPKNIIQQVRNDLIEGNSKFKNNKKKIPRHKPFENPYIKSYENVTILYADIVNYTNMTNKLEPMKLIETLNVLFGSFDDESEILKVLRVKFLGDCYYCVAGLPPDNIPNHAEACVDLGLRMIKIIKSVSKSRDLDINMRIGIHSGNISGGIIGRLKWQFDIWSKDVNLANRMETAGEAGKVHISEQTKVQLKKVYNIVPNHKEDPVLVKAGLKTYLISPEPNEVVETIAPRCQKMSGLTTVEEENQNTSRRLTQKKVAINLSTTKEMPNHYVRRMSGYPNSEKTVINPATGIPLMNGKVFGKPAYEKRPSGNPNLERRFSGNPNLDRRFSGNPNLERRASGINNIERKITSSKGPLRRSTADELNQRRTAFMDNNIYRYQKRIDTIGKKLEEAIESMPLSKYDQWITRNDVNPLLLIFKDFKKEKSYLKLPDPLFKYYLLSEIVVLVCIIFIQNITMPYWEWTTILELCTMFYITVILLPLTWTYSVWNSWCKKYEYDSSITYYDDVDETDNNEPNTKIIQLLYKASDKITRNVYLRTTIFITLCLVITACALTEMLHCEYDISKPLRSAENVSNILFIFYDKRNKNTTDIKGNCVIPWHMTETCALAIIMTFLFLRIHVWLKLLLASTITVFYSYFLWNYASEFYDQSETFNYLVKPSIAHILSIVYLTFTLHLIDRQTDYMHRLDHKWNEQLIEEQDKATNLGEISRILLENILPIHVAELYLNTNKNEAFPRELYYEQYTNVAVMFASIVNYNLDDITETYFLPVMNEIIGEFDKLLENTFKHKVEKIKIANWTYMAASGLDPGRRDSGLTESNRNKEHVAVTLLKFAVGMRLALKKTICDQGLRNSEEQLKLRVGICHGEVTAGVVGSKKPLYDIWGDTVNKASRMDSTGVDDSIQVTEGTAIAISESGYQCEFRDFIYVKGISREKDVPDVPTYLVTLNENGQLQEKDSDTDTDSD